MSGAFAVIAVRNAAALSHNMRPVRTSGATVLGRGFEATGAMIRTWTGIVVSARGWRVRDI